MIPTFENLIENQIFKIQKANEAFTEFMIDCNSNVIEIFFEDLITVGYMCCTPNHKVSN